MKKLFLIFVFALLCNYFSFGRVFIPKDSIPGLVIKTARENNLKPPYIIHSGDTILVSLGNYVWGLIATRVFPGDNLTDVVIRASYNISDFEMNIRNSSRDMRMDESRKAHAEMETLLCSGPWKVVNKQITPQDQASSPEKEDSSLGQIIFSIFLIIAIVIYLKKNIINPLFHNKG